MKKILLFVSLLISTNTFAQINSVSNRVTARLGFASTDSKGENTLLPNLKAEFNYGILHIMEVGAYIGYGFYQHTDEVQEGAIFSSTTTGYSATNYGVNIILHIVPLIVKDEVFNPIYGIEHI